jgi:hypothetical protein
MTHPHGIWFKCKGCGMAAGYFPDGHIDEATGHEIPAGATSHTKPAADANKVPVQCSVYRQLSCEAYWALHQDAERLPDPTKFEPIVESN